MEHFLSDIKVNELKKQLQDLPEDFVWHHLTRLEHHYFNQNSIDSIKHHVDAIQSLSQENHCNIKFSSQDKNHYQITIIGYDYKGLFSIISGLLSYYGFNILSGNIYTYKKCDERHDKKRYEIMRKKIIDTIDLSHDHPESLPDDFETLFFEELNSCCLLLSNNEYQTCHAGLNQRIAALISKLPKQNKTELLPIDIDITHDEDYTFLNIQGEDTPVFLFALANALSLKDILIHNISISTTKTKVSDSLTITDKYDRPITSKDTLEKLKTAIVLIKQFTFLLPHAPDPDRALRHFDQLLEKQTRYD